MKTDQHETGNINWSRKSMKKQQWNMREMVMIKQKPEQRNINRTEMLIKEHQHQTGKMNMTETNNIELMKKQQHDKGNTNKKELKEQQDQTRNIKRKEIKENEFCKAFNL